MRTYLDLVERVLANGEHRTDRTGVGTISLFGEQIRFDLREGFPLVTTKKVNFSSVVKELLWFLRGETNTKTLGCKIWDEWADGDGNLGPIYGQQWRAWGGCDQITYTLEQIKRNPYSRRHIVSAWNVSDIPDMALPPCHVMFQFYVGRGGYLDLQLYQRSADLALGVPFNIASYALLLSMFANECRLTARHFVHTFGDVHAYMNHVDGLRDQLTRTPQRRPIVTIPVGKRVLDIVESDIHLTDYYPYPPIKFEVAV